MAAIVVKYPTIVVHCPFGMAAGCCPPCLYDRLAHNLARQHSSHLDQFQLKDEARKSSCYLLLFIGEIFSCRLSQLFLSLVA